MSRICASASRSWLLAMRANSSTREAIQPAASGAPGGAVRPVSDVMRPLISHVPRVTGVLPKRRYLFLYTNISTATLRRKGYQRNFYLSRPQIAAFRDIFTMQATSRPGSNDLTGGAALPMFRRPEAVRTCPGQPKQPVNHWVIDESGSSRIACQGEDDQ